MQIEPFVQDCLYIWLNLLIALFVLSGIGPCKHGLFDILGQMSELSKSGCFPEWEVR